MKRKKFVIIAISIVVILAAILGIIIVVIKNQTKPEDTLNQYMANVNEKNYEAMYEQISEESKNKISKEEFVKRNKNIYEGIDAVNIEITMKKAIKEEGNIKIPYQQTMQTSAGTISFENTVKLVKEEKNYKINWSSSMIFSSLRDTDKIRVSTIQSKRGEIIDRNGEKLAENGTVSTVGIVAGKLAEKEQGIKAISELTGISTEYINSQLEASYVKEDTFVPLKKIAKSNKELKQKLLQIPGVQINNTDSRVYPLGKEAAHLTGYVQSISSEELKEKEGKGYHSKSVIGKAGLEKVYEDRLKGIDGTEIYIIDSEGNKTKTLAKQDKKDGEDIKITIDSTIQKKLYTELENDKGLFVVMKPQTGELLAAISTPSYDANSFVLGMTTEEWNTVNHDPGKPLYNRFLQSYCPGSTFKPITAAIGLSTGKLTENTNYNYSGLSWQKNSSWGNYKITTLTGYNGKKDVRNALIYSDNIFFAQAALEIGKDTLAENLRKIGFKQPLEFPLSLKQSQYSNQEEISSEIKLADTGYGQADLLVNPIHMASIYSGFANDGKMVKPYLEYNEKKVEYYNKEAFTKDAAETVKNALIQVVENPEGTANDMKLQGITIAGKTGTAELKTSNEDEKSGTLGWFNCFTTNQGENNKLIIGMVENAQDNRDGGSHYVIKMIKSLF